MRAYWTISVLLLACGSLADETKGDGPLLRREKKDIAKLQALFGGWGKEKPYPIASFEDWKRPVHYVPQGCNCNWRPSTRYGEPGFQAAVVVPARPVQVQLQGASVIPSEPAIVSPPQAARLNPPPPQPPVIPSSPALLDQQPCIQADGYGYGRPAPHIHS